MPHHRIGFGLLGAGVIAPTHANALRASDKADFVAVADLHEARRTALAQEYGCTAYADLDALLADPAVQAVNISIPNHLHFAAAMACMRAGKHVLVEKPPALSLRDIDEMMTAAAAHSVKIGVILQARTRANMRRLRQAIDEGRFGRIYQADVYMKWYRPPAYYTGEGWRQLRHAGAGVTIQQGIHYIDMLHFCLGPVRRVEARMTNVGHPEVDVEDTLTAFTEFHNGARSVIQASTAFWPGAEVRLEINGEHGCAVMLGDRMTTWQFAESRPEDAAVCRVDSEASVQPAITHAVADFSGHLALIDDLVDAIHDDREPLVPLTAVRPTMEWVLAMYQSAKYGAPIDLPMAAPDDIW